MSAAGQPYAGVDAPPDDDEENAVADLAPPSTEISGPLAGVVKAVLRRAVRDQNRAAHTYVRRLRERYPDESPAEIRARLDAQFLTLVTGSGAAVGATGAVPGVGTLLAVGAIGTESLAFLEATAFYALAMAELHGIDVRRGEHEELLVMTILLGASDTAVLSTAVTSGAAASSGRSRRVPRLTELHRRMMSRFLRRFAVKKSTLALGKLAPAGIGAAVGGWGNRKLGRSVVDTAHASFGAPPGAWPGA